MEFLLDKTHPDYRGIDDIPDHIAPCNYSDPLTHSPGIEGRMLGDIELCNDCLSRIEISNAIDDAMNMDLPYQFDPQPEPLPIRDDQLPLWMKDQMFGKPYYDNDPL